MIEGEELSTQLSLNHKSSPRRRPSVGSSARFELLESKLLPPRGRGGPVSRGKLVEAIEGAWAVPVVLLIAGPGWGKTTLLAEWAARSQRPFAWLDVDENDNDPIVLLTHVAAALDRVAPVDPGVFDALGSRGVSVEATVVPRLGAALATIGRDVVLVLDDVHRLDNPVCLDAVASLARHVPEGSQLALSARREPSIEVGALRARGLAFEIGPDELRMDAADARQLVSAAGVDLGDDDVAELVEHTEGWCAGLYLAALSVRARGGMANGAAKFTGSNRIVGDYLRSELLAQISPDERRFLTRTAVLERMSGPLCDAVLDGRGSRELLESLGNSNLFLVPLDADGEWYRYHRLFRELLRAELARAEPERVPRLLARATDWCEANGQLETAIRYAQAAGDVDRVARLVELCGLAVYRSGRVATMERWLGWLERAGARERNAAVAVLGALVATTQGRPAAADRWADAAERASYDGTMLDGSASVDSWRALLRALRCRSGLAGMRADAELALRTLGRASPFRPTALLLLGLSLRLSGEIDQADDVLEDAAAEGAEMGAGDATAVALAERAALAIKRDAWVQAEQLADGAARVVRSARMEEYPTSAFAYAVAARVAHHREEAQRAQELLVRAQRLRARLTYALPHFAIEIRLELARAYLTIADAGGAGTMLREIDAILRRQADLGTLPSEVEELHSSLGTMRARAPGASSLTPAELRVIPYLATHLSFREIGQRLYLSNYTVKSHAIAVYRKLSVTSRSDAVERARELGLV
jgi:LuxR family maltose regulon positive regulatory protein